MNTTRKITLSLITVLTLFFATSCKEDVTSDLLPVITSKLVTVDYRAANIQGDIASVKGLTVIDRGVCWSKRTMPTIDSTKMSAGQGVGSFTCSLVGLTPDSIYYVRAYATSKIGTTYSTQIKFKAPVMLRFKPKAFYDSIVDVDGNKYYVDTIGTQIWMCQNLRVTKYLDGSPIPNITSNSEWIAATTAGYCNYNNNASDILIHGLLYNWYAATDSKNIAPVAGWRVATAADWATLSTYLGGNAAAGAKLKESGFDNWQEYSGFSGSNISGFTATPSGFRSYYNGKFDFIKRNGYWWTSDQVATYRGMSFNNGTVDLGSAEKANGYSIRCVKDVQ